ncbi:hypothetical protein E2986_11109 [Frieseomelitta varia]|uniref:Uncharacterized protein n=1 Tax=Frieseomelitta varia TaxID=561572 RepID=A0A833VQ20_9HYME|nr:hypothetical protein E2986_11109 [Frieseomelitta varia]
MSRLRGSSSIKEGSKVSSFSTDRFHHEQPDRALKSCKSNSNRYHFGMTRQPNDEVSKNGRDYKEHVNANADLLYKKSKEHFGAWDIKDIVQDESVGPRKQTVDRFEGNDARLINGRSRDDRVETPRARTRTGSVDREQDGSHGSRRKENWENSKLRRSKRDDDDDDDDDEINDQRNDEREQLLREIENLAIDGRSPDRKIRAMIDRFRSREDDKLKSRIERECSRSPEKIRVDRANEPKSRDHERYEQEDDGRNRSADRETERKLAERTHRRPSREADDEVSRRRRNHAYDSNPEDFDVRIQRYERAVVEPRRDLESFRRVSLKDSTADLGRKDSLKDHDRQVTRKSSFEVSGDTRRSHSRDRESSLSRKTSLKGQENDPCRKNSFKNQDQLERKYFGGRDTKHVSRKSSSREQNSDYGRILPRNRDDTEQERKRSLKGHADGVSRITFKEQDYDSIGSVRSCRDREDVGLKVGFKDRSDSARRNSFKEKTVEFGGICCKDGVDGDDLRNLDEPRKGQSPNGRYVELGSGVVSFRSQGDEEIRTRSPPNDSEKRRRSPRGKNQDAVEKRSDRHSRPLTPPKRDELRIECREDTSNGREPEFDSKSWHESNRIFAARYFRENSSRYRANPDGRSEIDRDPSPETRGFRSTEIDSGSRRGRAKLETHSGDSNRERDSESRCTSTTHERNGATIIRIRTSPETAVERRRRRRPLQDTHAGRRTRRYEAEDEADSDEDDEEEEEREDHRRQRESSRGEDRDGSIASGRGVSTPSRRVWNYREGVWHFHESIAFDRSFMVQKREAIFINRWRR